MFRNLDKNEAESCLIYSLLKKYKEYLPVEFVKFSLPMFKEKYFIDKVRNILNMECLNL